MFRYVSSSLLFALLVIVFPGTALADICGITHESDSQDSMVLGEWKDGDLLYVTHDCRNWYAYEIVYRSDEEEKSLGYTGDLHRNHPPRDRNDYDIPLPPVRIEPDTENLVTPDARWSWDEEASNFESEPRDETAPRTRQTSLANAEAQFEAGDELTGVAHLQRMAWRNTARSRYDHRQGCVEEHSRVAFEPIYRRARRLRESGEKEQAVALVSFLALYPDNRSSQHEQESSRFLCDVRGKLLSEHYWEDELRSRDLETDEAETKVETLVEMARWAADLGDVELARHLALPIVIYRIGEQYLEDNEVPSREKLSDPDAVEKDLNNVYRAPFTDSMALGRVFSRVSEHPELLRTAETLAERGNELIAAVLVDYHDGDQEVSDALIQRLEDARPEVEEPGEVDVGELLSTINQFLQKGDGPAAMGEILRSLPRLKSDDESNRAIVLWRLADAIHELATEHFHVGKREEAADLALMVLDDPFWSTWKKTFPASPRAIQQLNDLAFFVAKMAYDNTDPYFYRIHGNLQTRAYEALTMVLDASPDRTVAHLNMADLLSGHADFLRNAAHTRGAPRLAVQVSRGHPFAVDDEKRRAVPAEPEQRLEWADEFDERAAVYRDRYDELREDQPAR